MSISAELSDILASPCCTSKLVGDEQIEGLVCSSCGERYPIVNGFPVLLADELARKRFVEHEYGVEREVFAEQESGTYERRVKEYLLPLLRDVLKDVSAPRILEVGCGIGEQLDILNDYGYAWFGIEPGGRVALWAERKHKDRLFVAEGEHLPFADESFDFVTVESVLEHVGCSDKHMTIVDDDHVERRVAFAAEVLRVTKEGGRILVTTPNRLCVLDPTHGGGALGNVNLFGLRIHSPREKFTLSFRELHEYFVVRGGADRLVSAPFSKYFAFERSRKHLPKRCLGACARLLFRVMDRRSGAFLKRTPICPYLIEFVVKGKED